MQAENISVIKRTASAGNIDRRIPFRISLFDFTVDTFPVPSILSAFHASYLDLQSSVTRLDNIAQSRMK